MPVEHRPQGLDARHADVTVEGAAEGLRVDEVELVRLVHRPLEAEELQFRREVDQRLHRIRQRDPMASGDAPAG
jgi:hypothetical protein